MEVQVGSFQAIFDQVAVGIGQASPNGEWQLLNDRFCEIVGHSREELLATSYREITHPDDRAASDEIVRRLLAGEISSSSLEKRYVRKDGSVVWARLCVSLVRDLDNLPRCFISVIEDITDRIQAEQALKESERRLELALRAAGLGLWDRDLRTGVTVISGEYARLHALPPNHAPLTHEEWLKLVHPDDRDRVDEEYRRTLERTHSWDTEFRLLWPDGSVHWILAKGQMFLDHLGRPVRLAGISLDVTERKRVQEERMRLASIVDSCEDAIFSNNLDGTIMSWNAGAEKLFGYAPEEIAGQSISILLPSEGVHEFPNVRERIQSGARLEHYEVTSKRKDGRQAEVSMIISPLRDSLGTLVGSSTIARDVTDRKRAEAALRQSEERYRLAIKATNDAIWDIDLERGVVSWNETYSTLYGRPAETSDSWQWWIDRIHPEDRERTAGGLREAIRSAASSWTCEYRLLRVDGAWAHIYDRAYIARHASGKAWRVIGAMQDLTSRKQVEAALRESEERFRNMADTAPVMIWMSAPDKLCTFFNRAWLTFTGRTMEEERGNGWADGVHPEDLDGCIAHYSSALDARQTFQMEYRLRRADGQYRWVLDNGVPRFESSGVFAGYIGSCFDITDLRRAQEEALARQKLESLGVLAGGIAHDFNNLLGGILAQAELAAAQLVEGGSPNEVIQRISTIASRGAEIVRELLIYSGQDKADPVEPLNLSRLVEEMLELLKLSISKHAVLKTDLNQGLPTVRGRASQVRQIIMNLVINASEAVEEKGGVIKVTTSQMASPRGSGLENPVDLSVGEYVNLEISDTGCGMTEEVQSKIFDPFFTTKFAGRGLGLAVVQGIVRDHGGAINLVSAPGEGTTIGILLPCIGKTSPRSLDIGQPASGKVHQPASGTVLIVEDEDALRLAIAHMLRKRGLRVMEAGDGSRALELIRAHKDEIDVMLLDITLPGISSRAVFEETRQLRAHLKVILTSAYGRQVVDDSFTGLPVEGFIRKPFRLADLIGSLEKALAAKTSPATGWEGRSARSGSC